MDTGSYHTACDSENNVATDLNYKQIPQHLSGGVRYYLTLQEFDSWPLQHHPGEVIVLTTCLAQIKNDNKNCTGPPRCVPYYKQNNWIMYIKLTFND